MEQKEYLVKKVSSPIDWTVEVPGSKSITNRALLLAALSAGEVVLHGVLFSDDTKHFLGALRQLGFPIAVEEEKKQVTVVGCGGRIPCKEAEIDVGSAGTAARFLTAMLAFSDGRYTIRASEQMKRRPMKPLLELLREAGAGISYLEREGFLPVKVTGRAYQTKLGSQMPLSLSLDIGKSTQFLSALLLSAPMLPAGLIIRMLGEKADGSYIRITRDMMREFGVTVSFDGRNYQVEQGASYRKASYEIEPDMSAACYFYAAAAVTGGRALVKRIYSGNRQGDFRFLSVLEQMGCTVTEEKEGIAVSAPADGRLRGIAVNMNDFSDQALTLAAIAPFAEGEVQIDGIRHIREQECDRIHAITQNLRKLGIVCREKEDGVVIASGVPKGGALETYEDHRVAMAFSLIGLCVDGIRIKNPACCGKTFEGYFALLDDLTNGR